MADTQLVEYRPKIADIPLTDRPRERLLRYGSSALSNAELLAVILRVGGVGQNAVRLAEALLAHFGGLAGLAQAGPAELTHVKGVGAAKVAQIKAALELGRRLLITSPDDRPQVLSPGDAANLLMLEMGLLEQEHLRVVLLDTRNRVLAISTVYIGSLNSSMVRVGELYREAIRGNAAAIIVAHNHPSGDPTPHRKMWRSPGHWYRRASCWITLSLGAAVLFRSKNKGWVLNLDRCGDLFLTGTCGRMVICQSSVKSS